MSGDPQDETPPSDEDSALFAHVMAHLGCGDWREECDECKQTRPRYSERDVAEMKAKIAELDGYLDAIAAIPEVDAAEGGCDDAVRNAIAALKDRISDLERYSLALAIRRQGAS